MTTPTTKICGKCRHPKPLEDFYRATQKPDGRQWACKLCWPEVNRGSARKYEQGHRRVRDSQGVRRRVPKETA